MKLSLSDGGDEMKCIEKTESGIKVLQLHGRIDSLSVSELSGVLTRTVGDGEGKVLLDLSGLEYMSSAGLHALTDAYKMTLTGGGELALCAANENLTELFSVVHLDKSFKIYTTDFEALDDLIR
jgi:anti-anti-sigma factor